MSRTISPFAVKQKPSRWRQFSLRSLLVLILLCCIALGAWTIYIEPYRRQHRLAARIIEAKGEVSMQAEPNQLNGLFKEPFFTNIVAIRALRMKVDDAWMANLQDTPQLRKLHLPGTEISDTGLAHIERLGRLQELDLSDMGITDKGLARVGSCTSLQWLRLTRTNITDSGLAMLEPLRELKHLSLRGCSAISDAGLEHLADLHNLESLDLSDTKITDAGMAHLQNLTRLQSLSLDGTQVTEACLPPLKQLPSLQDVTSVGTSILPSTLRQAFPRGGNALLARTADRTLLHFVNTPLVDVTDYLRDYHKVEILLDKRGMLEAGIKAESPITINFRNAPLGDGFRKMLDPLGLTCSMHYGAFLITTKEQPGPLPPRLVLKPGQRLSKLFSTALYTSTPIEFVEFPLADVFEYLNDRGVSNELDEATRGSVGDLPVTQNTRLSAADGLEFLFYQQDLHGVIEDNVIQVYQGAVPESLLRPITQE